MTNAFVRLMVLVMVAVAIIGFATPAKAASVGELSSGLSGGLMGAIGWSPLQWLRSLSLGASRPAAAPTSTPSPTPTPAQSASSTPSPSPKPPVNSILDTLKQPILDSVTAQEPKKVVAGWLVTWDEHSFNSFKNNLDVITEVHPFVYTIGADGVSLVPDPGSWQKNEVMRLAKENNIKVIPTIAGDVYASDRMLNDPAKRTAHIKAIIREIEANGYDGWNIDYEGFLNGYNRDVYAAFMTEFADEMHKRDKIVAISVEAFNRQQDWDTIGKVVERFMLMGYDYNSARGPSVGPIGPASWLKEVVDYTQTRVPKEKIVLGLGSYGYSWIHNGAQYVSEAVSHGDALSIAAQTGSQIRRGQDDTPYFTYNRGLGLRHLYFEDAQSTRPKLDVANNAGIAGIAFWRLGTEDANVWDAIREKINQ